MAKRSTLDRLADKFLVGDGCWEWTAYRMANGYGTISMGGSGKKQLAHRVVYETFVGPIPAGLHIDHLCRNRGCVRPDHLEPVTPGENIRRGMSRTGTKTHCSHGHEFTPENTHVWGAGYRKCKTCNRLRAQVQRAAR